MSKQKLYRSMTIALLAALVCMLGALSNVSATHAAAPSQKSFAVKEGTVSGFLTSISTPHQLTTASTSRLLDPSGIQYFVVTGQLVGTRYSYPLQFTANPGQKIGLLEISSDPLAHTQVIAVGAPTNQLLNPAMPQGASLQGQTQGKTTRVAPSISNGSASHHYTTTWYDPVGITVNWVKDTINYGYNGNIVTSFYGSDNRWWLSNDGWFEASHYIGSGYIGSASNPDGEAAVYTGDTMQNNIFCAGNSTYVYYSNNAVIARGNGSAFGSINTWDGGGCSSLLHYGTTFG